MKLKDDVANLPSLSTIDRTILLARIAHLLTVSARGTYEPGTENILKPQLLRAYNELMHQITSSIQSYAEGTVGMPLEAVLETMQNYGEHCNIMEEMKWVLKVARQRPFSVSH